MHGARFGLGIRLLSGLCDIGGDAQGDIRRAGVPCLLACLPIHGQALLQLGDRRIGADEDGVSHLAN